MGGNNLVVTRRLASALGDRGTALAAPIDQQTLEYPRRVKAAEHDVVGPPPACEERRKADHARAHQATKLALGLRRGDTQRGPDPPALAWDGEAGAECRDNAAQHLGSVVPGDVEGAQLERAVRPGPRFESVASGGCEACAHTTQLRPELIPQCQAPGRNRPLG